MPVLVTRVINWTSVDQGRTRRRSPLLTAHEDGQLPPARTGRPRSRLWRPAGCGRQPQDVGLGRLRRTKTVTDHVGVATRDQTEGRRGVTGMPGCSLTSAAATAWTPTASPAPHRNGNQASLRMTNPPSSEKLSVAKIFAAVHSPAVTYRTNVSAVAHGLVYQTLVRHYQAGQTWYGRCGFIQRSTRPFSRLCRRS